MAVRKRGKTFYIEEWPASRADNWIMRLAFTFNKGGGELPMDLRSIGWEGVAIIGINTFLRGNVDPAVMIPIADELMECVTIVEPKATRSLVENDIEDFSTRLWLKGQVLKLTFGFFLPAASPTLTPEKGGGAGK